jgi:hypothetical protein
MSKTSLAKFSKIHHLIVVKTCMNIPNQITYSIWVRVYWRGIPFLGGFAEVSSYMILQVLLQARSSLNHFEVIKNPLACVKELLILNAFVNTTEDKLPKCEKGKVRDIGA